MEIKILDIEGIDIAIIESDDIILSDRQSALDLIGEVRGSSDVDRCIIQKKNVDESFFDLKTGVAGEALQRFINYGMKIAIVGDYSHYTSKSLKDFLYESNNGRDIFFVQNEEEAMNLLTR